MTLRLTIFAVTCLQAIASPSKLCSKDDAWFRSDSGRKAVENVISWQSPHGSWPKNRDTSDSPIKGKPDDVKGTFDNAATTGEIRFLARDGVVKYRISEIERERRGGYAWHGNWGHKVSSAFATWKHR